MSILFMIVLTTVGKLKKCSVMSRENKFLKTKKKKLLGSLWVHLVVQNKSSYDIQLLQFIINLFILNLFKQISQFMKYTLC